MRLLRHTGETACLGLLPNKCVVEREYGDLSSAPQMGEQRHLYRSSAREAEAMGDDTDMRKCSYRHRYIELAKKVFFFFSRYDGSSST